MPSIINATTTNGVAVSGDNSGSLQLQTNNGTTAVTIDTSQNLGIGTASPTQKLDVNGTAKATTVQATTLSDGTNSTSTTNCIQGSAKAWVRFAGSSGTVAASYNVSSVTRTNTGRYTVNLTNAMTDANYSISATSSFQSGVTNGCFGNVNSDSAPTTTAFSLASQNTSGTYVDATIMYASIFR